VVCASSREAKTDVASLIDSKEEEIVLTIEKDVHPMARTRFDQ